MNFKTTEKADEDIIGIYVYGMRRFGTEQAERYHAGLIECFSFLCEHPFAARERSEFDPPVRLYFHQAHVVVYLVRDDILLIVRVLHGRQDWERHLRP
ncbi:type II toxin-antitoxin system RelE/ParE family toxin (plasmid) [Skermanella rosea]|uniref:type II toxin-antitoxin system RelE/ParE family toxin n=1 Tax=Skermanella rosea TaxID=1817965 RepID=UPI0019317886|nr:type II toxin-antitoxin system RelE/ParE family toxin [Skermanella rosea]UEM06915.1 type II toxin-antitoxin system RelE/ParE family toxin [Skermanella rosea]